MVRANYLTATLPALVVLGFFVWFANWIPQTRWVPPERKEISADMSPAQLAVLGETIVRERGCLACHTLEPGVGPKGQGRGPNLADIAARRAAGVAGGPGNLVDYLVQALYEPGAYLVEGYSNIMPAAVAAPARLTDNEVVAVVAYLQSLGGTPTAAAGSVKLPRRETAEGAREAPRVAATEPAAILDAVGCLGCHSLKPDEVLVGPPLLGSRLRKVAAELKMAPEAYVMQSIVLPRAVQAEEFPKDIMPDDYGEKLTAGQLNALVDYLLAPGGTK